MLPSHINLVDDFSSLCLDGIPGNMRTAITGSQKRRSLSRLMCCIVCIASCRTGAEEESIDTGREALVLLFVTTIEGRGISTEASTHQLSIIVC